MENFTTWRVRIRAVLLAHGLWAFVGGQPAARPPSPPSAPADAGEEAQSAVQSAYAAQLQEYHRKDAQARAIIVLSTSPSMVLYTGPHTMSARETWERLCSVCQPKGLTARCALVLRLWRNRMRKGERVRERIDEVRDVCARLEVIGQPVSLEDRAIALLVTLPPSWDAWVQQVDCLVLDPQPLDFSTICELLVAEEQRRLAYAASRPAQRPMSVEEDVEGRSHSKPKSRPMRVRRRHAMCFDVLPLGAVDRGA